MEVMKLQAVKWQRMEAPTRIELVNNGFADRLRRGLKSLIPLAWCVGGALLCPGGVRVGVA